MSRPFNDDDQYRLLAIIANCALHSKMNLCTAVHDPKNILEDNPMSQSTFPHSDLNNSPARHYHVRWLHDVDDNDGGGGACVAVRRASQSAWQGLR